MDRKAKYCPAWLATFADLMSLLMAMFVLLYAMSSTDEAKYIEVVESLTEALVGKDGFSSEQMIYIESIKSKIEAKDVQPSVSESVSPESTEVKETLVENLNPLYESLLETFSKNTDSKEVNIEYDASLNQIKVVFPEQIAFDPGRAELKPRFAKLLKESYELKDKLVLIKVIGHTDKQPIIGGRFHSNWELSSARAANVVVELVASGSIRPDQAQAIGVADSQPVSVGNSQVDFAKNRRVEVLISPVSFKY